MSWSSESKQRRGSFGSMLCSYASSLGRGEKVLCFVSLSNSYHDGGLRQNDTTQNFSAIGPLDHVSFGAPPHPPKYVHGVTVRQLEVSGEVVRHHARDELIRLRLTVRKRRPTFETKNQFNFRVNKLYRIA